MAFPPDKVVSGCVWDALNPLCISGPRQGTRDICFFSPCSVLAWTLKCLSMHRETRTQTQSV